MLAERTEDPTGHLISGFDATTPLTVGLEEEVMLLRPGTDELAPLAAEVVAAADHPSVKLELPVCQVELMTRPHADVRGAIGDLVLARRRLLEACAGEVVPVAAAVHPSATSSPVGTSARHRRLEAEYGEVARRQLVGSLQVHVATGSADSTLAVYNSLRGYLPELAALAACAPFQDGRDTGLASVRPLVAGQLPRQGVPPRIDSWEQFAADLRWGATSGAVPEPRCWWWELRPHVVHGTLEVRVPDVQATVEDAEVVVRMVHALVAHLVDRHLAGDELDPPPTWRIAENRWRALRDGVHSELIDLRSGTTAPATARLGRLIDTIEPHSREGDLEGARRLLRCPPVDRLRRAGPERALGLLAELFPPP